MFIAMVQAQQLAVPRQFRDLAEAAAELAASSSLAEMENDLIQQHQQQQDVQYVQVIGGNFIVPAAPEAAPAPWWHDQ